LSSRIILIGLIMLIICAPAAVGSVYIVTYSAMEFLIFSLLLLHLWTTDFSLLDAEMLRSSRPIDDSSPVSTSAFRVSRSPFRSSYVRRTLWLMLPLFLFLFFSLFQMVPLPFSFLHGISPGTAGLYQRLGLAPAFEPGSMPSAPGPLLPLSLSLSATSAALLKWLAYASIFFVVATFAPQDSPFRPSFPAYWLDNSTLEPHNSTLSHPWITWLLVAVFVIGFADAIYGLYTYLNQSGSLLWFRKKYYTDCVTGTYINRNHFAGLMNMCIPVSIGLFASGITSRVKAGRFLFLYFLCAGIVVMVLGLIFSMSRMAHLSLAAASLLVLLLMVATKTRRAALPIVLALVLVLGFLWGTWKGLAPVEERWQTIETGYEDRSLVWQSTLKLIESFPLTGTGLGTYELAYPPYKPQKLGAIIMDHAHNDYLEFLSEAGLIGFIPWLAFFLLFLAFSVGALLRRRNRYSTFLGAGGLAAVTALLVHSLADFNLQIPANAMLLFLLMGLTWRIVNTSSGTRNG
jgi:O-antigen ligase